MPFLALSPRLLLAASLEAALAPFIATDIADGWCRILLWLDSKVYRVLWLDAEVSRTVRPHLFWEALRGAPPHFEILATMIVMMMAVVVMVLMAREHIMLRVRAQDLLRLSRLVVARVLQELVELAGLLVFETDADLRPSTAREIRRATRKHALLACLDVRVLAIGCLVTAATLVAVRHRATLLALRILLLRAPLRASARPLLGDSLLVSLVVMSIHCVLF